MKRIRYAVCGLSTRSIYHFVLPLLGKCDNGGANFSDRGEVVGVLDLDEGRVRTFCQKVGVNLPYYGPDDLPRMLAEQRPETVLVAGPDYTHGAHIVGGLRGGCDVITEKTMVVNCREAQEVRRAERESGRRLQVAFNYRYAPLHKRLKRLILDGRVGRITNVEFVYNLDTWHGSSYFYRWNRRRANSGGLNMHKCCHHFDLVNWWLGDVPEELFAYGALNYYGKNGALRPRDVQGRPLDPVEEKRRCPIFQKHYAGKLAPDDNDIRTGWDRFGLPYDAQYPPTQRRYIYDDEIDIEDTYSVVVRYRGGASMSYSFNACTPWEGYILGINGTAGRLQVVHHSNPDPTGLTAPAEAKTRITCFPLFGGQEVIEVPPVAGGHGGADGQIQHDLFVGPSAESRELALPAGSEAGALAVAMGEAVVLSMRNHRPYRMADLLADPPAAMPCGAAARSGDFNESGVCK